MVITVIYFLVALKFRQHENWPSSVTLKKILANTANERFLAVIRQAKIVITQVTIAPPSLKPIQLLELSMSSLRNALIACKKRDSLLTIILSNQLDDIARLHALCRPGSVLPGRELFEELEASREKLVSYRQNATLMNATKRRMLLKMRAMRAFIGDRKIASLYTWESR